MHYDFDTDADQRPESGERGLACAIIRQAVQDYRRDNKPRRDTAGAFFRGVWFVFLADGIGLDVDAVRERLRL